MTLVSSTAKRPSFEFRFSAAFTRRRKARRASEKKRSFQLLSKQFRPGKLRSAKSCNRSYYRLYFACRAEGYKFGSACSKLSRLLPPPAACHRTRLHRLEESRSHRARIRAAEPIFSLSPLSCVEPFHATAPQPAGSSRARH